MLRSEIAGVSVIELGRLMEIGMRVKLADGLLCAAFGEHN